MAQARKTRAAKRPPHEHMLLRWRWCTDRFLAAIQSMKASSFCLRVAPNGFRASACQHAIEDRAADGDLCALSRKRSCPQASPDDPLVSTYCRFNQGAFAVASRPLPTQAAIFVDRCYVIVSLAAGFGLSPLRRVRAWRNDDPSFGAVTLTHNGIISWITIIGAIGSELTDLVVDLVEQGFHLRDIASFLIRQGMSNNLAAIGMESQMQLTPPTTGLGSMLFIQPLAGAVNLYSSAVDEHMNWTVRHWLLIIASGNRLPRSCPTAERTMIGNGQFQSPQRKHRIQQSFSLAQSQSEHQPQRQGGLNCQIGISWLAAPCLPARGYCHPTSASGVIHSVKLPRRRRPASYSAQFVTLNFILPMR